MSHDLMSYLPRLIPSFVVAFAISSNAGAQEALDIRLTEQLGPELRGIIARVFDPNSVEALRDRTDRTTPQTTVPPGYERLSSRNVEAWELLGTDVISNEDDIVGNVSDLVLDEQGNIEGVVVDVGGFLGLGGREVYISSEELGVNVTSSLGDPIYLVPNDEMLTEIPIYGDPVTLRSVTGNLLEGDLEEVGYSSRRLVVPDTASSEDVATLIAALSGASGVSIDRVPLTGSQTPQLTFDIGLENFRIDEVTDNNCVTHNDTWPIERGRLRQVAEFNEAVLTNAGLPGHRTDVLIMDSGISPAFSEKNEFQGLLSKDQASFFLPRTVIVGSDYQGYHRQCHSGGPAGMYYRTNSYGFYAAEDDSACFTESEAVQIAPVPSDPDPDRRSHGTSIALLAVGGPSALDHYELIGRRVGLRFAKVFREESYQNSKHVAADVSDLLRAIKYASQVQVDLVNASFSVDNARDRDELTEALNSTSGVMVVAAAGNQGIRLFPGASRFPAAIANGERIRTEERLTVVGAVASNGEGTVEPWQFSNHSSELVDILAPGVDVPTVNSAGETVCVSGTSAAAPFVTFTMAMVQAYGLKPPEEPRRRVLATADTYPAFADRANGGRVLNISAALDIYVDLVWLRNEQRPRRVQIMRHADEPHDLPTAMPRLCSTDWNRPPFFNGRIDVSALILWLHDGGSNTSQIWYRPNGDDEAAFGSCSFLPEEDLTVRDLETGEISTIQLDQISKIVPTAMRRAFAYHPERRIVGKSDQ